MSTHTITAGHGYKYLTSQTVAQDVSVVPAGGLGAYYAEHGEAPGQWVGRGLAGLGIEPGAAVTEAHMVALFGEGRHPESAAIAARLRAEGQGDEVLAAAATELGRPFALNLANSELQRQVAQLSGEWNRSQGLASCAPVPAAVRSRIRTAVGQALFAQQHGREPDVRELSGFIAQQSRVGSKAVAGFDLTFSPVKSVSALWALAPAAVAGQIEAAHRAAVADTIGWLERTAAYTRLGRNGVRQVETRGLVATAFVHRSSRAGDPDLHTHVAVSNKVQTLDGRWRALDGRMVYKATVAASERYNTRLEAELRERLGVWFVDRARPGRPRPVREIDGIDDRLLALWSKRRAVIDTRRGELSTEFQREHGRPPTPVEAIELAQRATLDTRPRKHAPTAEGEQRAAWHAEAVATLGEPGVQATLQAALRPRTVDVGAVDRRDIRRVGQRVIERLECDRASWQRWHVIAQAQRELRCLPVRVADLDAVLAQIVDAALSDCSIALSRPDALAEPEPLRRSDGVSVYTVAGSQLYTSRTVLAAEQSLLAAANRLDGQAVSEPAIEMALLEATANGLVLNDGQVAFVRELAGSGARCQLALAPAGTGKTTALQVLARAWAEDGGQILTLAPSAAAARLLGQATGTDAQTLARGLRQLDAGEPMLDRHTLVLLDEAGMASTPDLARLVAHAQAAGASVRLIGDDRQLAAVGAGGILRDLAETAGAITLTAAVRFSNPDEASAALGIRDGAPDALGFYLDAGRVRVGDEHTAALSAYQAWRADRAAGKDALLLAATRDQVSALNTRARADRITATGGVTGREVPLADGCSLSAGDTIITRHNDRRIGITATDWVKNGDRWTVQQVLQDGAVRASHHDTGRHVMLPAAYVAEHVALGYALTIHGAQGRTADTSHTVITGTECREQLYVALSRGRHANHVHVALPGAADQHAPIRRDSLIPPTATDLLQRVLDHEESTRSATTEHRAITDPARQLRDAAERYVDNLAVAPTTPGARPAGPAPLPWLEPVPRCTDQHWQSYLNARAEQITSLADEVTRRLVARTQRGTVFGRYDPTLLSHRALWNATRTDDGTGMTHREQLYARHLLQRAEVIRTKYVARPERRWLALVAAVDPAAIEAPEYPALAQAMTLAFRAELDVDRLLPTLLAGGDYAAAVVKLDRRAADTHAHNHNDQTWRAPALPWHPLEPEPSTRSVDPPSL